MTSNIPKQRTVFKAKIIGYLLNEEHKDGASKAAFFQSFGFAAARWEEMEQALSAHPDDNPVEKTIRTPWGIKFVVRCHVTTPDGRNPCIVTIWMSQGRDRAAFVTAYPA